MTEQPKRRAAKKATDWEKLAKHLQEALESALAELSQMEKDNAKLVSDNIKLMGIASYLERKIDRANYSI